MTKPDLLPGRNWYVAFTQPNSEERAAAHLQNQDYQTYLPRYLKRRRFGRSSNHAAPLFPRYVFVGMDIGRQRWRSVNGTVGVSYLICRGDRPICIPEEILSALAAREDDSGLVRLLPARSFRAGQRVRVTEGLFADQLGLYEGMTDGDRARILLDLLGRKVRVTVDAEIVAVA
jgi:transcriptional antiterminator RfaH